MTGTDFGGADLSGADFTDTDLAGSTLINANLLGTDFTRTNLDGVSSGLDSGTPAALPTNWTASHGYHGPWCCASRAELAYDDLTGIDLAGANLSSADLHGTNLTSVQLAGAKLDAVRWEASRAPRDAAVQVVDREGLPRRPGYQPDRRAPLRCRSHRGRSQRSHPHQSRIGQDRGRPARAARRFDVHRRLPGRPDGEPGQRLPGQRGPRRAQR